MAFSIPGHAKGMGVIVPVAVTVVCLLPFECRCDGGDRRTPLERCRAFHSAAGNLWSEKLIPGVWVMKRSLLGAGP